MITAQRHARFLTFLDGSGHPAAEVGNKGARLDRIISEGYPVPPAAVLTAAAYEAAVTERSLALLIKDLRTSGLPAPEHVTAESAAVTRSFLGAPLSDELKHAIGRSAAEMLRAGPVVVRSSVVSEDLASTGVPGHYLSVEDVADSDELELAVRRCWASLWLPAARAHRRNHHMHDHHIAMAVIVQHRLQPICTGSAFSSDPDGREHLLRIDTDGDQFLVRKDTLEVADGRPAPELVEGLARLIVRLERTLETPQEVSWVVDDAGLALLEVTPVAETSARSAYDDGFDTAPGTSDTYTPHGVIEMLPGTVSPLLWTVNAPMLENAFRSAFADLGADTPHHRQNLVARVRGRAALNLSAICRVAESLPGGNPSEVERQYLGRQVTPATTDSTSDAAPGSGVHLFAAVRSRRVHRRIADDVELIDTAARAIAELGIDIAHLPVRKLVAYRQRIRDLAWRGYAAEVGASSAAGATYRALEMLLERWLPRSEAAEWAQRLTRIAIDESTLGGWRATDLVAVLDRYAGEEIRALLATDPIDPRAEVAALGPVGDRFLKHLDHAVRSMGSKAVYGDVTWAEDDRWVWHQLHLLAGGQQNQRPADTGSDFEDLMGLLSGQRRWKRMRIITGQFVDLRARWLCRQVDETTRFLELREQAKNALLILGGEERRIIVEAAGRLIASRQLPSVELVDYLTDAELDGMLFGSCAIELSELENRRSVAMRCREAEPLPDWFTIDASFEKPRETEAGGRLEGLGTSPGQFTGTARVVASPADGARLQRGDVLVAHSTDPSWTPLFLTVGAVVLETGGPLSHASIVAREFGIPAVLSVPAATRRIKDGEVISVDGTAGILGRTEGGTA